MTTASALLPRAAHTATLAGMRRCASLLLALLVSIGLANAQTVAPPASPAPVAVDLGQRCVLDLPGGWVETPEVALRAAFFERTGSTLIAAYHPAGSRPTALPYALVELLPASKQISQAEQTEIADMAREYYLTSLRPPSKADRSAGWKSADVTPVAHDFANRRFSFHATIHYASGGDYEVKVAGVFGDSVAAVLSTWYDDAAQTAHGPEITNLSSSLRTGVVAKRTLSELALHVARVGGIALIVLVVAIQLYVLLRDRRQRDAAGDLS